MNTFSELGLCKQVLASVRDAGFEKPTEIQEKAIGIVLAGQDMVASAQTGSGKTAAYALPVIDRLGMATGKVRALIIVPTRELALQVTQQFKLFGKHSRLRTMALYGGVGFERQRKELQRGTDIVVATPGRLFDCLQRAWVDLSAVETLVLDEADRLLDMGFMPQVRKIVRILPKQRQTLMLSATIDRRVQQTASEFMRQPVIVKSDIEKIEPAAIEQNMMRVHEFGKDALLLKLLSEISGSLIIFAGMRRKVKWVADRLRDAGIPVDEIHGDISQNQRERTLSRFREGDVRVLVATDVAARGLDIPCISHIINYDVPQSAEDYVHRIGRTGRAGRSGTAITFVSDEQEHLVRPIERMVGMRAPLDSSKLRSTPIGRRRFRSRRRLGA